MPYTSRTSLTTRGRRLCNPQIAPAGARPLSLQRSNSARSSANVPLKGPTAITGLQGNFHVPTLQAIIASKYFEKLRQSEYVDAGKIAQLEELFASGKKIKVDELVKVFAAPAGSDIT